MSTSSNPNKHVPLSHLALRVEFHKRLVKLQVVNSCLNCVEWNPKPETCGKYKARPPAEVIVYGCPAWEEDIPF